MTFAIDLDRVRSGATFFVEEGPDKTKTVVVFDGPFKKTKPALYALLKRRAGRGMAT